MLSRIKNGLAQRYKQLTFRPYVIQRQICGEQIKFLIGDLFGEGWYGPHHDPWPEFQWIKDHGIRPGDTVIDCGANHGFSTVLFANWTGASGSVHAFEPLPHNVDILKKNLQLNGIQNALIHQVAAGDRSGTVALSNHPNAAITERKSIEDLSVPIRRLDEEMTVDANFIKIDVEGYELHVLQGASRLLSKRPRLAVELHVCMYQQPSRMIARIFDVLDPMDYSMWIQLEVDGAISPFDHLIHTPATLSEREVVHLFCI